MSTSSPHPSTMSGSENSPDLVRAMRPVTGAGSQVAQTGSLRYAPVTEQGWGEEALATISPNVIRKWYHWWRPWPQGCGLRPRLRD